jgi:hypothetical protein
MLPKKSATLLNVAAAAGPVAATARFAAGITDDPTADPV